MPGLRGSPLVLAVLMLVMESSLAASPGRLGFHDLGDARYVARSPGYAVLVDPTGIEIKGVRIELIGANPYAAVVPRDPLPGKANYFIGNDARHWRTSVRRFARIGYENAYPGIDLVYYGNSGRLEYDFIVAPGARPEDIAFRVHANDVHIDRSGDLIAGDGVRLLKPRAFQAGGPEIASRYRIADGRVTIEVADYDRRRELIIDPVVGYSTYLGGSSSDLANAIAVDRSGNVYVTGKTAGTFPTTSGAYATTRPSGSFGDDIFITKLDSKGALIYSTYLGGQSGDEANGIAVDNSGNVYVTGFTASSNFPTTPGSLKPTFSDDRAFVTKLNPDGNALVYSTYIKGTSINGARAIAVDAEGNAYITGLATSFGSFTTTPGVFQPTPKSSDAFVAKINAAGSAFIYASFLGGSGFQDQGFAIAADAAGAAYVAGKTDSTDFPTTTGALRTTAPGGHDAFVAKVSPSGDALLYSTYLGGAGEDRADAIAVDADGNAYVTGYTYATNFPTVMPVQAQCGCTSSIGGRTQSDAFVSKLSPTGSSLLYSTFYGGIGPDRGFGIGVDSAGAIYFGGTTNGISPSTFPLVDSIKPTKGLLDDAFAVRLNISGSAAVYSTLFGGGGTDFAAAMTIDIAGNVYLAGNTNSSDLPTTEGAHQRMWAGSDDAFVVKIGNAPLPSPPGPRRRAVRR
ncbi:MAG TPA: SBBP repeat-containing protein [Thermoanaerobaculia bacterium]|nr:SBBP repeat-containing protein [Thermoanaerobaculia bacterium]